MPVMNKSANLASQFNSKWHHVWICLMTIISAPGNTNTDCLLPHLHHTTTWNNKACLVYLLRLGWLHNLGLFNNPLLYSHVLFTWELSSATATGGNWAARFKCLGSSALRCKPHSLGATARTYMYAKEKASKLQTLT